MDPMGLWGMSSKISLFHFFDFDREEMVTGRTLRKFVQKRWRLKSEAGGVSHDASMGLVYLPINGP